MWIDAHAHLYDLDEISLVGALHAGENAGVKLVLNSGTSLASSQIVLKQCLHYKELRAAVGISPFDVVSLPANWASKLKEIAGSECVIALGEMGLDVTNPAYPDIQLQLPIFETQLEIAKELDLPVVIHSRGCEARVAELCYEHGIKKAMFHCFTGDTASLEKILDLDYYVSFSGIITFPRTSLRECVELAPLYRILIETDCPYLAPAPFRGKKNEPAWVSLVGKKVAEIKGKEEGEVAEAIGKNFERLFGGKEF
jgi:TatD DNase family protein